MAAAAETGSLSVEIPAVSVVEEPR